MATQTDFLKFSDKIYFNSTHYKGALSLYYVGSNSYPVVDQQKTEHVRNFERCVYQLHQVRSLEQQAFLWGEAAETAKYVSYGQIIKFSNMFSNRYLACDGALSEDAALHDDGRMRAAMSPGKPQPPPPGHPEEKNHERQLFRILPKYKIREVGERVRLEDQIVIENVSSGLFLHVTSLTTSSTLTTLWKSHQEQVMESKGVSPPVQHFVDFQAREQKGAAWQMEPYETEKDREGFHKGGDSRDPCVLAGSAVVLYHREAEGFLLCDWQIQDAEHAFLDHHNIQKATFNVLDLPYSSNALWVLEAEDAKRGGAILYQKHRKHYRLKHMATGLYLTLHCWNLPDGTRMQDVTTTYNPEDKNTLVAIHPLDSHDQSDAVTQTSFARLCFHHEEVWLHATGEYTVDEPVKTCVSQADQFKAASLGTTGKLQRVETTTKGYYEDVFAIRVVHPEEKESLMQVCNMVVTLERFHQYWIDLRQEREEEKKAIEEHRDLQMQRVGKHKGADGEVGGAVGKDQADSLITQLKRNTKNNESSKLVVSALNALKSLVLFCTISRDTDDPFLHNGPPIRKHQRILFQQNMHNLVFRILRAPMEYGGVSLEAILHLDQYKNLRSIYALSYRLVKLMVKGAKDMAQQMAQFLPFIESQLGDMTFIADAFMQIICDNDRLLESLGSLQLESFLWLIPEFGRKATYMALLGACCTCEGGGVEKNQRILVKKLKSMDKLRLIHPLKMSGDTIALRPWVGFPPNTERKIRRFKRKKESGEDLSDDGSSNSDSDSEDDERLKASPYAVRYSPRSRSASPQAALLSVAYNVPPAMHGCWTWACDTPCVVPRWTRHWLQVRGGSLLLGSSPTDVHPRTLPIYMLHHAKKDGIGTKGPPDGLQKNGLALIFKTPKRVGLSDSAKRNERRLLLATENMQDRLELLIGMRREIKHSATIDSFDVHLGEGIVNSATASLSHMKAQMNALILRNTQAGDRPDHEEGEDAEAELWMPLESWIEESDEEDIKYFDQSLRFLASLCTGGNEVAIAFVRKRFPPDLILGGMVLQLHHPLCDPIRSGFVQLARVVFVENGQHQHTPKEIIDRVKDVVYDFISRNTRQEAIAVAKNHLMCEMLSLAITVMRAGCYTEEELEHLFGPLLKLLDGTSDSAADDHPTPTLEITRQQQAVESAVGTDVWATGFIAETNTTETPMSPRDPGSPRTQESRKRPADWLDTGPETLSRTQRFVWTEKMQIVMESKLACCNILEWLFTQALLSGYDVRTWVTRVAGIDRRLGKHPEGAFLNLQTDLLTQLLLDVTLYKGYPALFRSALQLALVNISDVYSDPNERDLENEVMAITGLAEVLKTDLLLRNRTLTMNLFRHFKESREDNLTIALLRTFKTMVLLNPLKKEIEKMQCILDDLGVTPLVTQMIESKEERVVSEALQFGQALLQGGNRRVQEAVANYFLSLNDEAFFSCTKDRLTRAINQIKTLEASELHKAGPLKVVRDGDSDNYSETSVADPNARYKECELYQLQNVLRFLQLFCEGHNLQLQDYLREQDDNVHTYNLVKETITALKHLLMIEHCDDFIFQHVLQAFNTLTEYCQGPCPANQEALVNANIAFEVNVVLSRSYPLVDEEERDELKNAALTMLLSVLEGVEDPQIATIVNRTLDFKLIANLLADIWRRRKESNALDLGFTAFMLLRTLSTFHDAVTEFIEKCEGFSFYTALTGRIEILRDGSLVRVYFRIPFIGSNLSDKTKDELLWNVNRETPTARIADFYDRAEELIYEIEFYERNFKQTSEAAAVSWFPSERFRQLKHFVNSTINFWENAMIVLGFVINGIVCTSYVTDVTGDHIVRRPLEGFHIESTLVILCLDWLILIQLLICVFLLFDFWVAKAPLIAHRKMKKERQLMMKRARKKFSLKRYIEMFETDHPELDGRLVPTSNAAGAGPAVGAGAENFKESEQKVAEKPTVDTRANSFAVAGSGTGSDAQKAPGSPGDVLPNEKPSDVTFEELEAAEKGLLTFEYSVMYTLKSVHTDTHFIFMAASVVFALAGLLISPFFIALHLVSIINRSALLQNVIKAVTKNGRSLLLTVILGMIIIYLFSVVGFVLFRDAFQNKEPPCEGEADCDDYHCDTLFRCFVFAVTAGIRAGGGIGDLMQPPDWNSPYNTARTLFDFAFFVVVIVILLNIIFGVIIDTFAELRSEKQKVEEDIRSRCFICGIESSQFDRQADGFEHHIKNDHNMWNYIFFIHHLQKKDPDEFTGQESYVHSMMRKGDLSFFPLNKAVCLEGKQEEDDQVKELTAIHADTQKRVEQVEQQVAHFQSQLTKENQDMREYLHGVTTKVVEATAKRHEILGGLYSQIQREQQISQEGLKMRPLTPVG
ncbi:Inositol 1 [Diplonema papillatum]|nr:Inositol 1 [Diplonema papillatum]